MDNSNNNWNEITNEDGSVFYYNQTLNTSTWEKPNELKSDIEKLSGWNVQKGVGGKVYYYNTLLKNSVWEIPEDYKKAKERSELLNLTKEDTNLNTNKSNSVKNDINTIAVNNQTISYNNLNSKNLSTNTINNNYSNFNAIGFPLANNNNATLINQTIDKEYNENKHNIDYKLLSKEEINKLFKELLKNSGVTSSWTWDNTERNLKYEEIWKEVKVFSDKKQLFNEYIKECKIKEREEEKQKRLKLKENFRKMLEEDEELNNKLYSNNSNNIQSEDDYNINFSIENINYFDFISKYSTDLRFRAIDESEREELFEDYIDDILFKEQNKRQLNFFEKKIKLNFIDYLEYKYKDFSDFKKMFNTNNSDGRKIRWKYITEELFANDNDLKSSKVQSNLNIRKYLNFKDNEYLNNKEKLELAKIYYDYITKLYKEEINTVKKNKEIEGFKNRESFKLMMQEDIMNEIVNYKTNWSNYAKILKDRYYDNNDKRYFNLIGQSGSKPRDIFGDYINLLKIEFKKNKEIIKEIINKYNLKFDSFNNNNNKEIDLSFNDFNNMFCVYEEYNQIKHYNKNLLYKYILSKLKSDLYFNEVSMKDVKNYDDVLINKIIEYLSRNNYYNYKEEYNKDLYYSFINENEEYQYLSYDKLCEILNNCNDIINKNLIVNNNKQRLKEENIDIDKEEGELSF